MNAKFPGILIVVDGIDGAGKTTQIEKLGRALTDAGETVVRSKEPTDGEWGRQLRESAQSGRLSLEKELSLFVKDRSEHVEALINPSLAAGHIVLLDRYFYSTIAYQGSRGANASAIREQMYSDFPSPDATFFIDVLPEVGLNRISHSRGEVPNHFERLDLLIAIREVFLDLHKLDSNIHLIDGHPSPDEVFHQICHILLETALRRKRCAKAYGCEVFNCSFRATGECRWWELRQISSAAH